MRTRLVNPFLFDTPPFIKRLVAWTAFFSLIVCAFDSMIYTHLSLEQLLSLNRSFFDHFFLWQPCTALFTIPLQQFSIGSFFDLAFPLLILWCFGSELIRLLSLRQFSIIYFGSAAVSALAACVSFYFSNKSTHLSTCYPALLGIVTTWSMCVPKDERVIFFFLPISSRTFLMIALIGTLGFNLLEWELIKTAAYLASFLYSYLTGLLLWNLRGPFHSIRRFEQLLRYIYSRIMSYWHWNMRF
jgi:membrane associated rhomboid family serine protease